MGSDGGVWVHITDTPAELFGPSAKQRVVDELACSRGAAAEAEDVEGEFFDVDVIIFARFIWLRPEEIISLRTEWHLLKEKNSLLRCHSGASRNPVLEQHRPIRSILDVSVRWHDVVLLVWPLSKCHSPTYPLR